MKAVALSQGMVTSVDDGDFDLLSQKNWHYSKRGYAQTNIKKDGKTTTVWMHRYLLNPPPGMVVDHINGDKLDNRRSNLRIVSPRDNARNHRVYKSCKSGVSGVFDMKRGVRRWCAYISENGTLVRLGNYKLKSEAVAARRLAEQQVYGEYAHKAEAEAMAGKTK